MCSTPFLNMAARPYETLVHPSGEANLIGYARVSKADQNLGSQLDALREAKCGRVISEKISSAASRLGWQAVLDLVRPGDVVVVQRLDRMGRKLDEVVRSVTELNEQGVAVRALQQSIDTGAPGGRLLVALFAALAEVERETLRERTREGMAAARARGKKPGRPVVLTDAKRDLITSLSAQGYNLDEIAVALKIGRSSVQRGLKPRGESRQTRLELERPPPKAPAPAKPKRARKAKPAAEQPAPYRNDAEGKEFGERE